MLYIFLFNASAYYEITPQGTTLKKRDNIMNQYTEAELTNKIHTFLAKKSQKFPELDSLELKPVRKIVVRDQRSSNIFTALENMSSLWAQRIHS
jgi:hypothetical protein